jgi:hypothetical protein
MTDNCDNKVKLGKQDLLVKTKYATHAKNRNKRDEKNGE